MSPAPQSSVSLAVLLDEAVMEILRAEAEGRVVTELRVNPSVYAEISRAKANEASRGNPLTVLDLDLINSPAVAPGASRVA